MEIREQLYGLNYRLPSSCALQGPSSGGLACVVSIFMHSALSDPEVHIDYMDKGNTVDINNIIIFASLEASNPNTFS